MQLSTGILVAALLGANPAPQAPAQGPAPKAQVTAAPKAQAAAAPAAQSSATPASGSCCSGGASGGNCATGPEHDEHDHARYGMNPYASEDAWKEFVRRQFSDQPERSETVDPDPFGFSLYRGARPEPMGEQTLINGARMAIASLIVEDPPRMVGNYYMDAIQRDGHFPITGDVPDVPGMTYISFRPEGSHNLKTITLVPHGSGTVILASVGNPEDMLQSPSMPDDIPLPPKVELPSAIQQLEPGQASRSASFVVHESTVEQVRAFYRQELPRRGFVVVPDAEALPGVETWQKRNTLLAISVQPHTEPSSVAVSLMWLEQ